MCCTYIINSQQMIRDKCSPVLWCNLHLGMHYCSWGFQCLCHYNRSTVGNKSYFKVFCLHSSGGLFYLYKITVCVCVFWGLSWPHSRELLVVYIHLFDTLHLSKKPDRDPHNQTQQPSHYEGPYH